MATVRPDPIREAVPAALIARASTDHQGDTVEHQIMAIQEWVKQLSGRNTGERFTIQPQHIFKDEGESAWKQSILHRPAVKQFIEAVLRGEVRSLFIKGISRFNRDDADARMFFDVLDGLGIRVMSLEEGFDSRAKGGAKQIFTVHSFLAQMESDKKSVSVKIGLRQKAKKGEWKGGIPPYGFWYNRETKRLAPIEALGPVIRDIFALAEQGEGPAKIAHLFNETKRWAAADPRIWTVTQVQRILTRPVYVGDLICGLHRYSYNRTLDEVRRGEYAFGRKKRHLELLPEEAQITENAHEGIIAREQFDRVQQIMQARKRGARRAPNARYPLTGILICGHCGGPMIHHGRNPERGYQYYCCANKIRKGKSVCDQTNVRSDLIHELLRLEVEERLVSLRNDHHFWTTFKRHEPSSGSQPRKIAELDAHLEQAAANLAQFVLTAFQLSEEIRKRVMHQAQEQMQRLEHERSRLQMELEASNAAQREAVPLGRQLEELFQHGFFSGMSARDEDLRDLFSLWIEKVTLRDAARRGRPRKKAVEVVYKVATGCGPIRTR